MHNFCYRHGLKTVVSIFAVAIISFFAQLTSDFSYLLGTSILGYPEHEPFDGTAYPLQEVPDWVNLDSAKWDLDYNSLDSGDFMDIPYYDPEILKISTDTLEWGNPDHNLIRNSKITYSVPYMGNYLFDGQEYAGSHPAVDIKIPTGTPIYSIANGTVIKASNQSSGFGHHVVVQHNNVPTLNDPDANETLFSSYSHLSDIFVSEGDIVKKGQQVALSGGTGTATTPHLHFQIDTVDAPWHPFWPFTWQEISDAGLDFFSAVNAGLGKENALSTTINSMKYVQKYLDGTVTYVEEIVELVEVVEIEELEEIVELESEEIKEEEIEEEVPEEIEVSFSDLPKDHEYYTAIAYLVNEGVVSGYPDGTFRPDRTVSRVETLRFIFEGIKEILTDGDLPFKDVSPSEWYSKYLYTAYKNGVIDGYSDGTFKPSNVVNKAEFYKILFNGMAVDVNPNVSVDPFQDVSKDAWYAPYVAYAKELGIIDPDIKQLHPETGMTRGEVAYAIYKLLLVAK